jgi:hypothetical protein
MTTVGYTTATQGRKGVIHIVTSKNAPDWHIEWNEAWVLGLSGAGVSAGAGTSSGVRSYQETYANERPRVAWSAGTAGGRYLLQGRQVSY